MSKKLGKKFVEENLGEGVVGGRVVTYKTA